MCILKYSILKYCISDIAEIEELKTANILSMKTKVRNYRFQYSYKTISLILNNSCIGEDKQCTFHNKCCEKDNVLFAFLKLVSACIGKRLAWI